MNYEEKYKQALEIAKECLQDGTITTIARDYILEIFPELKEKESEGERIRKEILNVFNQLDEGTTICGRNYDYAKWITWLEKQGEDILIEEIKRRKELYSQEKEKAVSSTEKLSLGGRIAMLEELCAFIDVKQGEQKSTNKVEPKFKVGDKV